MKKSLVIGISGILVALSSCDSKVTDTYRITFETNALNIITDLSTDETKPVKCKYNVSLDYTSYHGTISSVTFDLNGENVSISVPDTEFRTNNYLGHSIFTNVPGVANGNLNYSLIDDLFVTSPLYYYSTLGAGKYTYKPTLLSDPRGNSFLLPVMLASYKIGNDYKVVTFQQDTFFAGDTNTTYNMGNGEEKYTTETIGYRLYIKEDLQSAVIIIYNAKFSASPNEPVKQAIIIDNLDINYSPEGIVVEGSDIIPSMVEGETETPVPAFIINNIKFETDNEVFTGAKITYTVAGAFHGEFSGMYVY